MCPNSFSLACLGCGVQGVLTSLTMETLDGDYNPVNSAFLGMSCVLVAYPIWLATVQSLRDSAE